MRRATIALLRSGRPKRAVVIGLAAAVVGIVLFETVASRPYPLVPTLPQRGTLGSAGAVFANTEWTPPAPSRGALPPPYAREASALPPPQQRYVRFTGHPRTGLNHQHSNLVSMLRFARALNRTLVLSRPNLSPLHNHGKPLRAPWSRYYDIERCAIVSNETQRRSACHIVSEEAVLSPPTTGTSTSTLKLRWNAVLSAAANAEHRIIEYDMRGVPGKIFRNLPVALLPPGAARRMPAEAAVVLPTSARVDAIARAAQLHAAGRPYAAVHIRRGDRLRQELYLPNGSRCAGTGSVSLAASTAAHAVHRTLLRLVPPTLGDVPGAAAYRAHAAAYRATRGQTSAPPHKPTLFVQTNEKNLSMYASLKEPFNALQFFDIPDLLKAEAEDNYLLYVAEQKVFEGAALKVYTFTNPERGQLVALSNCTGFH